MYKNNQNIYIYILFTHGTNFIAAEDHDDGFPPQSHEICRTQIVSRTLEATVYSCVTFRRIQNFLRRSRNIFMSASRARVYVRIRVPALPPASMGAYMRLYMCVCMHACTYISRVIRDEAVRDLDTS